jgi:hypothetical protein
MDQPKRIVRTGKLSSEEAARLGEIRRQAMADFPPDADRPLPASTGIGAQVRRAREANQLTWYSLAELAGIPDPAIVRDIEYGHDAQLSHIEAIASALKLTLELVEQA